MTISPQLLVLLIKTAFEIPSLAAEIKQLAQAGNVTDDQWEETASILATPGGTASYFSNDAGARSSSPADPNPPQRLAGGGVVVDAAISAPQQIASSVALYGALLPTDPSDDFLSDGDRIFTVAAPDARGGQVQRFFVQRAGDEAQALPANAIEYRKVSKQTNGNENR